MIQIPFQEKQQKSTHVWLYPRILPEMYNIALKQARNNDENVTT